MSEKEERIKKALASPVHLILVAYPEGGSMVHHIYTNNVSLSELVATLELTKFQVLRGLDVKSMKREFHHKGRVGVV